MGAGAMNRGLSRLVPAATRGGPIGVGPRVGNHVHWVESPHSCRPVGVSSAGF